jgi:catechol 2,3-dioxygenase-like lactoylglutathione lyase family enzyme
MPEVLALDHIQIAMPPGGEDAARTFYGGLLGLPEVPKPTPLAVRGGCWFVRGDVQLHLGVEAGFRPAGKAHPAFRIAGLDELATALAAAGHRVDWDDELPGVRRCYTDDPFGNRIELIAA